MQKLSIFFKRSLHCKLWVKENDEIIITANIATPCSQTVCAFQSTFYTLENRSTSMSAECNNTCVLRQVKLEQNRDSDDYYHKSCSLHKPAGMLQDNYTYTPTNSEYVFIFHLKFSCAYNNTDTTSLVLCQKGKQTSPLRQAWFHNLTNVHNTSRSCRLVHITTFSNDNTSFNFPITRGRFFRLKKNKNNKQIDNTKFYSEVQE